MKRPRDPKSNQQIAIIDDPIIYGYLVVGTFFAALVPLMLRLSWFLSALSALVLFPLFAMAVRRGRLQRAIGLTFLWSVVHLVTMMVLITFFPRQADLTISGALDHRAEMVLWIARADGPLTDASQWLPQELRDFAVFTAATLVTGGYLGLLFGAAHINLLAYYLVSVLQETTSPWAAPLAIPPWQIFRIAAYILWGVVVAVPVLRSRFNLTPIKEHRGVLAAGLGLAVLAIVLQLTLAIPWARIAGDLTGLAMN